MKEQNYKVTFYRRNGAVKVIVWVSAASNREAKEKAIAENRDIINLIIQGEIEISGYSVISKAAIDKSNLITIKEGQRN